MKLSATRPHLDIVNVCNNNILPVLHVTSTNLPYGGGGGGKAKEWGGRGRANEVAHISLIPPSPVTFSPFLLV